MSEINPYAPSQVACNPQDGDDDSKPSIVWIWMGVVARLSVAALVLYLIWCGDAYGFGGRSHFYHHFGFLGYYVYERSNGVVQAGFRIPQLAASLIMTAMMVGFAFPAIRSIFAWLRFGRIE